LEWQDGRCAICGYRALDLVTDHDHQTGLIRGELCTSCNTREGRQDRPVFVAYRDKPPAVILGVEERYWSSFTGFAKPEPEGLS
jgi:hypothetical protein